MDVIHDFEDFLTLLQKHRARYLIVGGMAFIFHAKPRYTKDMDLWVEFEPENILRVNRALSEFGTSMLLSEDRDDEIMQIGVAPDRIDLLMRIEGLQFDEAWKMRVEGPYGKANANWVDLKTLLAIKSGIDRPRHQEDARVLREVVKKLK